MKQKTFRFACLLLVFITALQACRTVKDETAVTDNGSAPSETERLVGNIQQSTECGFYITVIQGDVMRSYFPVNLEDRYKVEGLKVKFAWQPAKVSPPEMCQNFIVVTVSEVTPLR